MHVCEHPIILNLRLKVSYIANFYIMAIPSEVPASVLQGSVFGPTLSLFTLTDLKKVVSNAYPEGVC